MICLPCREAGEVNKALQSSNRPNLRETYKAMIQAKHDMCPGGTWCDCQHVIGYYVVERL